RLHARALSVVHPRPIVNVLGEEVGDAGGVEYRRDERAFVGHLEDRVGEVRDAVVGDAAQRLLLDDLGAIGELRAAAALFLEADPAAAPLLAALDDRGLLAVGAGAHLGAPAVLVLPARAGAGSRADPHL